jgi:hypothetical protein
MMGHNLKQTISLLTRTPAALDALLRGLPEDWVLRDEGEKTWSATEVVEHLIHGEGTDWIPRVRMILEFGENETFLPFDRGGHKRGPRTKSLEQLLEEFARVRSENLKELHALKLGPEHFGRRGRHPVLGVVTLAQLLSTWATHDLTHLHQISRILAYQYREAVGPWSLYLGVLRCTGHSSG